MARATQKVIASDVTMVIAGAENRIRYVCGGVAVTCMAVGGVEGIGLILLLYIVFGNLLQRCISNEKR